MSSADQLTPWNPGSACMICGNPGHSTDNHATLEVLNQQRELLAVIAGVLEPKRYRVASETVEDGSTKATLVFENWPGGVDKLWVVERQVLFTNSTGTPTAAMYAVESLPGPVTIGAGNQLIVPVLNARDMFDAPAANSAGAPAAPAILKGGEKLVVQFASLSAGARVITRLQLRQVWQSVD